MPPDHSIIVVPSALPKLICDVIQLRRHFGPPRKLSAYATVYEDMLCASLLEKNITASELFESLNEYFAEKLNWSFCVGVCTDGAAAMIVWPSVWLDCSN